MIKRIIILVSLTGIVAPCLAGDSLRQSGKPLTAPTYYLVARVKECGGDMANITGATNIPPQSLITAQAGEFDGDGWRFFTDESTGTVDSKGLFQVNVRAKGQSALHRNLLVLVSFMPYRPAQPEVVLKSVGRHGELLSVYGDWTNPQLGTASGGNYVLTTIARVPECALH
jgi:hypothetical protein